MPWTLEIGNCITIARDRARLKLKVAASGLHSHLLAFGAAMSWWRAVGKVIPLSIRSSDRVVRCAGWWGCSHRVDLNTLTKGCHMRSDRRVLRSLSGHLHVFIF
jgi:hypothetical protein